MVGELSRQRVSNSFVLQGCPENAGAVAARDISEEFTRRPWHENVTCVWDGPQLILQADNDFDVEGLALVDEFSDAISAYIKDGFDGDIEILSIHESEGPD
jgi:hypothetical protein